MSQQTELDHKNPGPQTTYEGREFEATIKFLVKEDATDDQVYQWLEEGGDGCGLPSDHPMANAELWGFDVVDCRPTRRRRFTDWEAESEPGKRSGRGRTEYEPR